MEESLFNFTAMSWTSQEPILTLPSSPRKFHPLFIIFVIVLFIIVPGMRTQTLFPENLEYTILTLAQLRYFNFIKNFYNY